jgi:hypothetical protein
MAMSLHRALRQQGSLDRLVVSPGYSAVLGAAAGKVA